MHTNEGKKTARGLEHFFRKAAPVKNERFANVQQLFFKTGTQNVNIQVT